MVSKLYWCWTSWTWHFNVIQTHRCFVTNCIVHLIFKHVTYWKTNCSSLVFSPVQIFSALLEANQQLVMFITEMTPFWLVSDTVQGRCSQDPKQNLGTPRPHLQIILTRCSCFLFPQKSIKGWPSIWNSNQLITCSVENVDIWFAWRISIMNRLFLLKSPFKKFR